MKQSKQSKFLVVLLTIVMVVNLFPTLVLAEDIGDELVMVEEVITEDELKEALTDVNGERKIIVANDIALSSGVAITGMGSVTIQGKTGNEVIYASADANFASNAHGGKGPNMFLIVGDNDIVVTLENITIDGGKDQKVTTRLFQVGSGSATSYQLTLGEGSVLRNAHTNESGGGVFVRQNALLTIDGGCIQNCISDNYGGGVQVSGKEAALIMNSGSIMENSGRYAGGICYYGGVNSKVELYGGSITNNTVVSSNVVRPGGVFVNGPGMYIGGDIRIWGNQYILSNSSYRGASDVQLNSEYLLQMSRPFTGHMSMLVRRGNNNTIGIDLVHVKGAENYPIQTNDLKGFTFSDISNEEYMFYLEEDKNEVVCKESAQIIFNANNGNDSETSTQKIPLGQESILDNNTFTREGYVFDGWNTQSDGKGTTYKNCEEVTFSQDIELYAMWRALDAVPREISIEYGSKASIPVSDNAIVLKNLTSSDASIVSVNDGKLKAEHVGEAVITATATTENGGEAELKVTVKVTPMLITYGSTGDDAIGWDHTYNRPAVVYSQPVGENEEQLSDHIWFYPAKESVDADSGEKIYIPDTEAAHIELEQGKDFTFSYTQNDNHVESTGVLPFLETVDSEGISEAIDVIVDMQNENYQFVTIGTLWKPWDQILLRVTVMAEGMERISMMNGDELLQNSLEKRILEYTGEGVAPAYDLTGISAEDIGEFTVHFHSVIEGISYDTHLYNKQPAELSADAVQAIAPKELGIYSMVVNGQNDEAKKYAYVSRRFEITKGNPTGEPEFDAVDSNVELSAIELSGSMKNAAGKPVEGVFEWIDDSQTVEQGAGYAWRFTPDDTEHYNAAEGESVVYPEEKPGSDKEDLAALIEYAQDAKDAENYKYVVPKVKELFEKALEDAIAVNAKEDATQKEIDAAYDALLAKVHLLDFTGNTESLTVLVGTASGKVEAMYTKESWAPFAEALEAAREVLADENALQAEIDTARDVLQAAMDALVENPIDTSKLEKLVADASVYEENLENYIPSTAESFMAALDGAREVLAGSEITQDAVDSAYATLLNAIFGLREVPNKDRLEELLGKVEAMDLSSYSEETANAVKAAVAMAAAVMEDENANQKQVDLAVTALEEAVAGLEAKEEAGTGDINTDNTESGDIDNGSKKDDSSVTDQKVASNDEGSKDTANKTTTAKTNAKTAAQTGDAAKAAVPAVAAAAALLAVWFVWKKK